jgi:hypothetical protein
MLRRGDGGRRPAAQADRHRSGGEDHLARRKLTHDPHDRPPLRLGRLGVIATTIDHRGEVGQGMVTGFHRNVQTASIVRDRVQLSIAQQPKETYRHDGGN